MTLTLTLTLTFTLTLTLTLSRCAGFELLNYTQRIEGLLRDNEVLRAMHSYPNPNPDTTLTLTVTLTLYPDQVLRAMHSALVPGRVSYRLFWQRHFYHLEALEQQARARARVELRG